MEIARWMKNRKTPGTLADIARRIIESDKKYGEIEKTLQSMYVLEAVIRHGGYQGRAAKSIGVTRHTVQRTIRALGLTATDIRKVAKHLQETRNAEV